MQEDDSLYIGRPRFLAVDSNDGSFYVADTFSDHIIRFDAAGRLLQVYGERGAGPGQFQNVGTVYPTDALLIAADIGSRALNLYSIEDAAYRGQLRYSGILTSVRRSPKGGGLMLGSLNADAGSGVTELDLESGIETHVVSMPLSYQTSNSLRGIYTGVSTILWADTVLVGFMGTGQLQQYAADWNHVRTVAVPAMRRRGVPEDMVKRMNETRAYPDLFGMASMLFDMHRLRSGVIALVHYDQDQLDAGVRVRAYASLVSPALDQACVDVELPDLGDSQPRTAFRADTLFLLTQHVAGQDVQQRTGATTSIRGFTLGDEGCEWLSTSAVNSEGAEP